MFERTFDGTEGEGLRTVTITGQDGAGNSYDQGALVASTVLDITPPTAVCMLAPTLAKGGDSVQLVVTTSEALLDSNALPGVVADIALAAPLPEPGETVFTFTHAVAEGAADVPEWTYHVTLVDRAGNTNAGSWACSGTGSIDGTPPAVADGSAGIVVSHEYVKDGTVLVVTFDMEDDDDELDSPPLVTVGAIELDAAVPPPGVDYKYTHLADEGQDEEGLFALAVSIQDLAGNQQFYSPGTVTFDFTDPFLLEEAEVTLTAPAGCPLSSVTAVTWGSTIDVSLTVDNLVAGTPVLRFGHATSGAMFTALDPESEYRTSCNYRLSGITSQQLGSTSPGNGEESRVAVHRPVHFAGLSHSAPAVANDVLAARDGLDEESEPSRLRCGHGGAIHPGGGR